MDVFTVSLTRHPARRHTDLDFCALFFHTWDSGTFWCKQRWGFFGFFSLDSKCHPSVDIPPDTHFSACNLHHLQCSWVWPLGAEAEHKYTELKMADWWMSPLWHSRLNKLNLNFVLVACLWKISHLAPLESVRCHKNQHLRIQNERQKHKRLRGHLQFSAAALEAKCKNKATSVPVFTFPKLLGIN